MFDWRALFKIREVPEATADVAEMFTSAETGLTPSQRTRLQALDIRLQGILRLVYEDEIARNPMQAQAFIIWRKNLAIRLKEDPNGKTSAVLLATLGRQRARPESVERVEEDALYAQEWQKSEDARNTGKRRCAE